MRTPRLSLPLLLAIAALVAVAVARSGDLRERAEEGLGRGMPAREAALARGFVLGQDDGIDAGTEEDFRRSGLSHLLAVSGHLYVPEADVLQCIAHEKAAGRRVVHDKYSQLGEK